MKKNIKNTIYDVIVIGAGAAGSTAAFHLAKALPCGTVSVNTFSEGDIKTPFGGYKQSGSLSRDQGTEALNSFLQTKTIWISHN